MEEIKTTESIKIVQHTKYGLIDVIENKDCLEVRQLSQYGGRDIVLILPENRKSVALAICPELTQQQSANAELQDWKAAQIKLTLPLQEFMHAHPELKYGDSAHEKAIEFIKERDELKKQNEELESKLETETIRLNFMNESYENLRIQYEQVLQDIAKFKNTPPKN